jgi:hypothetical protein
MSGSNTIDSLPFHSLSNNEFNLIYHDSENIFCLIDMDRLNQLKFHPFQKNNDIALIKRKQCQP